MTAAVEAGRWIQNRRRNRSFAVVWGSLVAATAIIAVVLLIIGLRTGKAGGGLVVFALLFIPALAGARFAFGCSERRLARQRPSGRDQKSLEEPRGACLRDPTLRRGQASRSGRKSNAGNHSGAEKWIRLRHMDARSRRVRLGLGKERRCVGPGSARIECACSIQHPLKLAASPRSRIRLVTCAVIANVPRWELRSIHGSAARLADRAPGTASRESNRERARGRLRTCHSRVPHRALGASDAIAPSLAPVRGNTPRRRRRSAGEAVLSPLLCEWTRDGIVCGRARTSGDRLGRADVRRRGAA